MKLVLIAAFIAACGAAKLDRSYLPPASAVTAGGSPGSIQTPFAANSFNQGLGGVPKGSFTNDFDGVVVDAAAPGTRASERESGLGAPRLSYGSTNSKVGDAAFKGSAGFRQGNNENANIDGPSDSQGAVSGFAQGSFSGFTQASNNFEPKQDRAQAAYDRVANTLRFESDVGPESYNFAYETDNGITAEENGVDVNGNHAQGGYSYTGDDGQVYSVTYVADEGGYQPRGDHLPTPPPIPEEILKSLEQNARDEAAGLIDDGSYDAQKYNAGADYAETDVTQVEQNDRQAPTFGKRPESDASVSGTFINQNNQAFVKPGSNEHVQEEGTVSATQELTNNAFQPSTLDNAFSTFSQSNQPQPNVFGSRIQSTKKQNGIVYNMPSNNRFDAQSSIRNPSVANNKYQSSISSDVSGQVTHNSGHSFGPINEYLPPVRGQNDTPQRPITTPQRFGQSSQNFQSTFQGNLPTGFMQSSQISNGFQQKPQIPINSNPQKGNRPLQSRPLDEQRPTLQPSAELTTPFESNEQSSASDSFSEREASFNSQKPTIRPTSQYENQPNRQLTSRPRPSFVQSQSFAQKSQFQGQYHPEDGEYTASTVRPSFNQQQNQGPDSSYYYKQPAKPFSAPSIQESKFPTAPFGQFNRVTPQVQASAHVTGPSQKKIPVNSFQTQQQQTSSSSQFPQQPVFAPINPTTSSTGQYQDSTTSSQYNGITQASASSFPSQNQGSTRYTRPQTAAPTIPTDPIRELSDSNKLNLATATAFVSTKSAGNFNSQNTFGGRPTVQTTTNRFQGSQSFSQPQPQQVSSDKKSDISPSVATQQYSGEIYEYAKPAEMLPAPAKPESSAKNQFELSQGSRNNQQPEQPRPIFAAPSQSNVPPSHPQYRPQSLLNKEQLTQSNFQSKPFESQALLSSRPQNTDRSNCCQSLDSQIAHLESQRVQGVRPSTPQFGSQFPGTNQGSSNFAAEEETFSEHRTPPRFDEETGYHY